MKLLLDAHISGKKVAPRLRAAGHDVRAANEEPALDGVDDADLLAIAAEEGRILIVGGIHHEHFGRIIAGITAALEAVPEQEDWLDRVHYLS